MLSTQQNDTALNQETNQEQCFQPPTLSLTQQKAITIRNQFESPPCI